MTDAMNEPDTDELELLDVVEGVEVYDMDVESLYLTSAQVREGADGMLVTRDAIQNLAVDLSARSDDP